MTAHLGAADTARMRARRHAGAVERGRPGAVRRGAARDRAAAGADAAGCAVSLPLPEPAAAVAGSGARGVAVSRAARRPGCKQRLAGLPAARARAAAARAGAQHGGDGAERLARQRRAGAAVPGAGPRLADGGRAAQPAGAATGLRLPATLVFDYPTPRALARSLRRAASGSSRSSMRRAPAIVPSAQGEPIAIVAMGCRFPGGVDTPGGAVGAGARRAATRSAEFPADRGWDVEALYDPDPDAPGKSYARTGGFLHRRGRVRRRASSASARARRWRWTRSSGCCWRRRGRRSSARASTRRRCAAAHTGVFVGVDATATTARVAARARGGSRAISATGSAPSVVSGRIAYTLGLEGPAVTRRHGVLVVAGRAAPGVPGAAAGGVRAGAGRRRDGDGDAGRCSSSSAASAGLRRDGRCKAFSARRRRHGLVRGRRAAGAGAAVRRAAQRPPGAGGGPRLGGQPGRRSNGLTAPNGPSQQRVIRQALANAGLSAGGRRRGRGARHRHDAGRPDRGAGAAGDLRPGSAGGAAAVAGLGQVEHRPHPGGRGRGGRHQDGAGDAARRAAADAARGRAVAARRLVGGRGAAADARPGRGRRNGHLRRAGVSSFGISGTNAHVILEEAPAGAAAVVLRRASEAGGVSCAALSAGALPFVLSGKSESALAAQARPACGAPGSEP